MSTPMTTTRRGTVSVLPVRAGACAACAQSIEALHAPRYASTLRERGITFARSPRHADVVLITGTVTQASLDELRRYLDGVPQPRALVAVGDCAIDGGVFAGSPVLVENPAEALDVNVQLGGCPPSPEAILSAITEAAQLLAGTAEAAANQTADAVADDDEDEDEDEAKGHGNA